MLENECADVTSPAFIVPLAAACLLVVASFATQWSKPASYGKFHGADPKETAKWERLGLINQRLGHTLSDAGPTLFGFAACYWALTRRAAQPASAASTALLALWLLHYVQRGVIHPLLMRYRAARVPALITIAGLFPNALFSWLNASAIACLHPSVLATWHRDPRFIAGVVIYAIGFVVNRYRVPHGGLFAYVSCANYLGELVQWGGWALATWSYAGLLWWLFALSTFVPRARDTHAWYRQKFPEYPSERKALVPFIW